MPTRKQHNRRSIRLRDYDYSSPGEYFITICTQNRECLFGEVVDGEMVLNDFGKIAYNEWNQTEKVRSNVELDVFVIMPNHMHAILGIVANIQELGQPTVGAHGDTPLHDHKSKFKSPSKTVGAIVRGYKSTVTKQINQIRQTPGQKIWQRNYYEHIIRNEKSLNRIRDYILNNPASWEEDQNHPGNF